MSAGEAFSVPRIVPVGHTTLGNHLDIQNITSVGHITNSATDKLENIFGRREAEFDEKQFVRII